MLNATDLFRANPLEPIYTYIDPSNGRNTNIASKKLHDWCCDHHPELEIVAIPTEAKLAKRFVAENSISIDHCVTLMALYLRDKLSFEPIIFCADGPNWSTPVRDGGDMAMLVDGHHRYTVVHIASIHGYDVVRNKGFKPGHCPSIILLPEQWKPFEIEGFQEITTQELRDTPILK